jgi:hypothetical protein
MWQGNQFLKYAFRISAWMSRHPTTNKPIKIGISTFISEKILPHHPDSEKFRELTVETTV